MSAHDTTAPEVEHDFGHGNACMYCGADLDTETVICSVRARAADRCPICGGPTPCNCNEPQGPL